MVSADAIAVDVTAGYTWTGPHIFQSTITLVILPEMTDTYDLGSSIIGGGSSSSARSMRLSLQYRQ